jgi:hypothetical protein
MQSNIFLDKNLRKNFKRDALTLFLHWILTNCLAYLVLVWKRDDYEVFYLSLISFLFIIFRQISRRLIVFVRKIATKRNVIIYFLQLKNNNSFFIKRITTMDYQMSGIMD